MRMKGLIVLWLGAFHIIANAALPRSDWIYYAESDKSGFEIYYSLSSLKKDGALRTVKIVKNYSEPQKFTAETPYFVFLSSVETQLINCEKRTYRNTRSEKWTEHWGGGVLGRAYDYSDKGPNDWSGPIKKTQIEGALMEKVCPEVL